MLSVHRSILRGDMNIFGSSVTKGLMTGLSRVMTYDIFGGAHSAKVWHLERWTKTNIQTSAPPSKRPHICDGSHRLDEALPLLRILPCAQILFVPKILRNCQNVGVVPTHCGHTYPSTGPSGHGCKIGRWGPGKKDANLRGSPWKHFDGF